MVQRREKKNTHTLEINILFIRVTINGFSLLQLCKRRLLHTCPVEFLVNVPSRRYNIDVHYHFKICFFLQLNFTACLSCTDGMTFLRHKQGDTVQSRTCSSSFSRNFKTPLKTGALFSYFEEKKKPINNPPYSHIYLITVSVTEYWLRLYQSCIILPLN